MRFIRMRANYLVLYAIILFTGRSEAQERPKALLRFVHGQVTTHVDNFFYVVAQQDQPVDLSQLSARHITDDGDTIAVRIERSATGFNIQLDSAGLLEVDVEVDSGTETRIRRIHELKATARLSKWGSNSTEKISKGEFKAQVGVLAILECCGFDARCKILKFDVLRASLPDGSERVLNSGARFEEETLSLISKADSGDVYVFFNIWATCGNLKPHLLEDIVLEID